MNIQFNVGGSDGSVMIATITVKSGETLVIFNTGNTDLDVKHRAPDGSLQHIAFVKRGHPFFATDSAEINLTQVSEVPGQNGILSASWMTVTATATA